VSKHKEPEIRVEDWRAAVSGLLNVQLGRCVDNDPAAFTRREFMEAAGARAAKGAGGSTLFARMLREKKITQVGHKTGRRVDGRIYRSTAFKVVGEART